MDLSGEFERLSLDTFEAESTAPPTEYSFVGLTVDSRVTGVLTTTEEDAEATVRPIFGGGMTVEGFFEQCYDAGVQVYPERDFAKQRFIGSGSAMEVYEGQWKSRGQAVALKYFKTPVWSWQTGNGQSGNYERVLESCLLELKVMSDDYIKRHENIAKLLGVSWHSQESSIYPITIMELAHDEHPTLKELLMLQTPVKTRLELLRDVLEGLSALHEVAVVHGDIKPENVLIFKSSVPIGLSGRLSDFGYCRPTADYKWEAGGTPYWNAPECLPGAPSELKSQAYAKTRDLYSLGLLACNIITRVRPFDSTDLGEVIKMKLGDEVAAVVSDILESVEDSDYFLARTKINSETALHTTEPPISKVPIPEEIATIVCRMVSLQPNARPPLDEIRASLRYCTANRVIQVRDSPNEFKYSHNVLQSRYGGKEGGVGILGGPHHLDGSLPRDLKAAMYENLLQAANNGSTQRKVMAMSRLGVFFLHGFGTAKSFHEAFVWFCRAAKCGDVEAKKMVLRMERASDTLPEHLAADLTDYTRASWMIDCIMDTLKGVWVEPRLVPEGVDINTCNEKIRQVLASIDRFIIRHGLVHDVEQNVIKIMVVDLSTESVRGRTREHVRNSANDSPALFSALSHVLEDNAEKLDEVLMHSAIQRAFLNRLVTVASDYSKRRALRTLIVKHGADPDYVDSLSGRQHTPIETAAIFGDYKTTVTLMDCGANPEVLLRSSYEILSHGFSNVMIIIFKMVQAQVSRELMDGLALDMNGKLYDTDDTPPDSQNPPSLFYAVAFNQLEKIYSLLLSGANPNIRFAGMTAVHLAVRLLHPTALLLLLAFGGDPNARNSAEGYTTPLHTLSEMWLELALGSPGRDTKSVDFLLRPYQPLRVKVGDMELAQRQALVIRILLEYGADSSARCIDGFTPLMTSVISASPNGKVLPTLLLQAKVPLSDRTSRDETILHFCVLANDITSLHKFLQGATQSLIDCKDISGCTPLFVACQQEDSSEIAKLLLECGADITVRGTSNLSTFDIALLGGHLATIEHLFKHTASLSSDTVRQLFKVVDVHGRNIFHYCLSSQDSVAAAQQFSRLCTIMPPDLPDSLVAQCDKDGYTPAHIARLRNNIRVLRTLERNFSSIVRPFPRAGGVPPTAPADSWPLKTLQDFLAIREAKMKDSESVREAIIDECEYTGSKRTLTSAEIRHRSELDTAIQSEGENSPRALWRMNTLGTVHERYGRLRKAQGVYYRGWRKSLHVLGPKSPVTQDFASKILRVLRDQGLPEIEVPHVANWHALNGRDTLKADGFIFASDLSDLRSKTTAPGRSDTSDAIKAMQSLGPCDRTGCAKPSTIVCKGCKFVRYCSAACQTQDIIDPRVQHLAACLPVETVELSQALHVRRQNIIAPGARPHAQLRWDDLFHRMQRSEAPRTAPPVLEMAAGVLTPRFFKKPVAFRTRKNSVILFAPSHFYEIRFSMRCAGRWISGVSAGTFVSVRDGEAVVRPAEAPPGSSFGSAAGTAPKEEEDVPIWSEIIFDCDLSAYFP